MNNKLYKLMNWPAIEEVIYSESSKPSETLGITHIGGNTLFQCYYPEAYKVDLYLAELKELFPMEKVDDAGYYAILLSTKYIGEYKYRITFKDADSSCLDIYDAYAFTPPISLDNINSYSNRLYDCAHRIFGAHIMNVNGIEGVLFSIWIPNAIRVSVVGDFNNWDGRIHQMNKLEEYGVFTLFVPEVEAGSLYKYEIKLAGGITYLKSDPYATYSQLRPENASVVTAPDIFKWTDRDWIDKRKKYNHKENPMSIYELYLGSLINPDDNSKFINIRKATSIIIDYVQKMGYTHIELMPIMEHPHDATLGYQTIGYYSPTARYGTPADYKYFINELHNAGISIILDWNPSHFPKDNHGLATFDGTCLYEHLDPRQGENKIFGTLIYNYGRQEVSNYLLSSARYWVEEYHIDGIRVCGVSSMLYLDYGREDGNWVANIYGSNENLEAIEFIKHLNIGLHDMNKGIITIADETTAWPLVTDSVNNNGLGFDFKWNNGWTNDYINYIIKDPYFRSYHHNELTFSMAYAYSERFILAISHDESINVRSLINRLPLDKDDSASAIKLTYAYMYSHPGKKLIFMGQDAGIDKDWNEDYRISLTDIEKDGNIGVINMMSDLNSIYMKYSALWKLDYYTEGFKWVDDINNEDSVVTFLRKDGEDNILLIVANFANIDRKKYQIGVPIEGRYKEIFNTDSIDYNGNGFVNARAIGAHDKPYAGYEQSISINIGAQSVAYFSFIPYTEAEKKKLIDKNNSTNIVKATSSIKNKISDDIEKADSMIVGGSESLNSKKKNINNKKK